MEIKAKVILDREAAKALSHIAMYKKKNPKKSFVLWLILCLFLAALVVASAIYFKDRKTFIYPMIALALLVFLNVFMYYILPGIQYRSLSKMKDTTNDYVFCDSDVKVSSQGEDLSGETTIEYTTFIKAYETSKYFFLFQDRVHLR